MGIIEDILNKNKEFVKSEKESNFFSNKYPKKKTIILTCMDTRLTELLLKAMDLKNGDVNLITNAGGIITEDFGDVIRSILIAVYSFDLEEIIVVGHNDCGIKGLVFEDIKSKMLLRGIDNEIIQKIESEGIDLNKLFLGFDSEEEEVVKTVDKLKKHSLIPKNINIHGLMLDPNDGKLKKILTN